MLLKLLHIKVLSTQARLLIFHHWKVFNWIGQPEIGEEFVVCEFEKRNVEFSKCAHHFEVDIEGQSLIEFVWLDPSDRLAHDLNSIVDALDGEERFCEAL